MFTSGDRVTIESKWSKFNGCEGTIMSADKFFQEAAVEIDDTNGMRRSYVFRSLKKIPIQEQRKLVEQPQSKEKSIVGFTPFIIFPYENAAHEFGKDGKTYLEDIVVHMVHTIDHGVRLINKDIDEGVYDDGFPKSVWYNGKAYNLKEKIRFTIEE